MHCHRAYWACSRQVSRHCDIMWHHVMSTGEEVLTASKTSWSNVCRWLRLQLDLDILYFEISRYISISGWSEAVRSGQRQGGDALPVSSLKIDQTYQTIPSVRARLAQKGSKNIKDKSSTLLNSIGPDAGCSECPAQSDSGRFVYIACSNTRVLRPHNFVLWESDTHCAVSIPTESTNPDLLSFI